MPQLFSYIVATDDGAAPNPFHGLCTLAICKPTIRRSAALGDWVVGLGSKNAPSGDLSRRVVYAMKIKEIVSLEEYDRMASARWPHRIPNFNSLSMIDRLGDCIYDFSTNPPQQRLGVHSAGNRDVDLRGRNALISDHFYYFGSRAIPLPDDLNPICCKTQGHRSTANQQYFDRFVEWISHLGLTPGQLYGWPDFVIDWQNPEDRPCKTRQQDDGKNGKWLTANCDHG